MEQDDSILNTKPIFQFSFIHFYHFFYFFYLFFLFLFEIIFLHFYLKVNNVLIDQCV